MMLPLQFVHLENTMKNDEAFFRRTLNSLIVGSSDRADIFYERREDFRCTLSSSGGEMSAHGYIEGAALRLIRNGMARSIHIEAKGEEDLELAAKVLKENASFDQDSRLLHSAEKRPEKWNDASKNSVSIENGRSVQHLMRNVLASLKEFFRERFQYSLSSSFYRQEVKIMNINGEFVRDEREAALFRVAVTLSSEKDIIFSESSVGSGSAERMIEDLQPEEMARHLLISFMKKKSGVTSPSGEMPVVLSTGTAGIFFHEAAGHLFEADSALLSKFPEEVQKLDFGGKLSICDDPSCMDRGSYHSDDEGMKSRKKAVIEQGKLTSLLHSVLTARTHGVDPSGNGRRQSFRDDALPRASALYVEPSDSDPEEIVRSTKKGIYVTKLGDAFLDDSSGDFYIHVIEGAIIQNGKIGPHLQGAIIKGNAFEIFKKIDLIGNDLSFDATGLVCSKSGQALPSSVGAPTMRIASILVFPA